jgi:DNA repair protein RecN (Recombination protein N)
VPVLLELRVENLVLIERAELRLGPGLNVLTGETGAGKTVLAHALDLLLGGRARGGIVRPGAAEAYVEGVFELPAALREALGDRVPADAQELVLARRVTAEGRTRAYLGGRSAGAADLREAGERLLAFYGQHEHRKLTLASAQLDVLDGFCGAEQAGRRARLAPAHAEVRVRGRALEELRERSASRERELDLLRFELDEIEAAAPDAEEARELGAERERLRHLEALRAAALAAAEALTPDAGSDGAAALLAGGAGALDAIAGVDPALDALAERTRALALEVEDLGGDLRRYEAEVEGAPGRLEEVEARLDVIARLERKHGGTVEAVLEHAARCRERRDELEHAGASLEEAGARLGEARARRDALALEARAAREAAAPRLAATVRERLGELAMDGARFDVELGAREEPGPAGADLVEFVIAPNPGVPPAPLREIASGGELSRVMLALMAASHEGEPAAKPKSGRGRGRRSASEGGGVAPEGGGVARGRGGVASEGGGVAPEDGVATLVFDEVDAGIGGHTARAVGEQLRALARRRQILCITHLPQIASLGGRHFRIVKDTEAQLARTVVEQLAPDEVIAELVRMLGAEPADLAARRHAKQLLSAA